MKDVIKVLGLIAVGLLTAILLYPFLHESGHVAAAYISGADIVEVQLLPVPYVLCDMSATGSIATIAVGLGGMVFPFLVTELWTPRNFWIWYIWFVIKGICILSFVISIAAVVMYQSGIPIAHEDMTQAMECGPEYALPYCLLISSMLGWGIFRVVRSKPLIRCMKQFGV